MDNPPIIHLWPNHHIIHLYRILIPVSLQATFCLWFPGVLTTVARQEGIPHSAHLRKNTWKYALILNKPCNETNLLVFRIRMFTNTLYSYMLLWDSSYMLIFYIYHLLVDSACFLLIFWQRTVREHAPKVGSTLSVVCDIFAEHILAKFEIEWNSDLSWGRNNSVSYYGPCHVHISCIWLLISSLASVCSVKVLIVWTLLNLTTQRHNT